MEKKLKLVSQKIPKGMKWSDKVKLDARKEDIDAVDVKIYYYNKGARRLGGKYSKGGKP